jgi:hypothetical protein
LARQVLPRAAWAVVRAWTTGGLVVVRPDRVERFALSVAAAFVDALSEIDAHAKKGAKVDREGGLKEIANRAAKAVTGSSEVESVLADEAELTKRSLGVIRRYSEIDEKHDRQLRDRIKAAEGSAEWELEYAKLAEAS